MRAMLCFTIALTASACGGSPSTPTTPSQQPSAQPMSITVAPTTSIRAGTPATFNITLNNATAGTLTMDFGDGMAPSSSVIPAEHAGLLVLQHTFAAAGEYTLTLTFADVVGNTASMASSVFVGPVVTTS